MNLKHCVCAAGAVMLGGAALFAAPAEHFRLFDIYSDNMVFQRNRPVVIRGEAEPSGDVKVELRSADGELVDGLTVKAGEDKIWQASLKPMEGGYETYTLTVSGAGSAPVIELGNIVAGEVWLCSGQSNMEMPVCGGKHWSVDNAEQEVAAADHPYIRLFNGSAARSYNPSAEQTDIGGGVKWLECSPDSVRSFSAAGYFFARTLNEKLNVPVGVISEAWGGTDIQPWISAEGIRKTAGMEPEQVRLAESAGFTREKIAEMRRLALGKVELQFREWENKVSELYASECSGAEQWTAPGYDDSGWEPAQYTLDSDFDGMVMYRAAVDIPEQSAGKALTLHLGVLDDCDITFFNGVRVGETGSDAEHFWSAERNYRIPAELVRAGRNVIAVRLFDQYSDGGMMDIAAGSPGYIQSEDGVRIGISGWKSRPVFKLDTAKTGSRPVPPQLYSADNDETRLHQRPAALFNAMIAPWIHFPLRGVIWYQGENNVGEASRYALMQTALVLDWRARMNDSGLAFIPVQLSSLIAHHPNEVLPVPARSAASDSWAWLRDAQNSVFGLPRTGMAVCLDIGNPWDIHPSHKQDVGKRLAAEAMRICYGGGDFSTGPRFSSMTVAGSAAELSFTGTGSGLIAKDSPDGRLNCFTIAGKDGVFYPASAVIKDDKVVVSAPGVSSPVSVRYAWSNYPYQPNLFNREGFPAGTFRTDVFAR